MLWDEQGEMRSTVFNNRFNLMYYSVIVEFNVKYIKTNPLKG